jgi:hypothetical protein
VVAPRLELEHATIAGNSGAPVFDVTTLVPYRSAVNVPPADASSAWPVCAAGVTTNAEVIGNLFGDASCGLPVNDANRQGVTDFRLRPLADNGGPIQTSLPQPGSPLVNMIPPALCPIPSDARGVTRPQNGSCDVGAVEQ